VQPVPLPLAALRTLSGSIVLGHELRQHHFRMFHEVVVAQDQVGDRHIQHRGIE
jgi:hypothetical protein